MEVPLAVDLQDRLNLVMRIAVLCIVRGDRGVVGEFAQVNVVEGRALDREPMLSRHTAVAALALDFLVNANLAIITAVPCIVRGRLGVTGQVVRKVAEVVAKREAGDTQLIRHVGAMLVLVYRVKVDSVTYSVVHDIAPGLLG